MNKKEFKQIYDESKKSEELENLALTLTETEAIEICQTLMQYDKWFDLTMREQAFMYAISKRLTK